MKSLFDTNNGIDFIEKYKNRGYIVDIYSDEWVNSLDPDDYFGIDKEDLEKFDQNFGTKYRGHLLAIYIGDGDPELIKELRETHKPFDEYCSIEPQGWRKIPIPSLLFANIKTREILCIGLGYKNRIYSFELSKYINSYNKNQKNSHDTNCSEEFFSLDHKKITKQVLKIVENLGNFYYEYDSLPGNADVMVTLNEEDGLYYLDDYDGYDGMTESEVEKLRAEYAKYSEWIDDCIDELSWYFPKIESWDLNLGIY